MDVPGALDLRDHDHVELVADLGDQGGQVVEDPGALERVDPGPELGVAEVDLVGDLDQALAGGDLVVDRDGVLEVAEQDVGLLRHVGDLRRHLLVRGVEEMDHPRGPERHLEHRIGRADGERVGELAGVSQVVLLIGFGRGARDASGGQRCRIGRPAYTAQLVKRPADRRGPPTRRSMPKLSEFRSSILALVGLIARRRLWWRRRVESTTTEATTETSEEALVRRGVHVRRRRTILIEFGTGVHRARDRDPGARRATSSSERARRRGSRLEIQSDDDRRVRRAPAARGGAGGPRADPRGARGLLLEAGRRQRRRCVRRRHGAAGGRDAAAERRARLPEQLEAAAQSLTDAGIDLGGDDDRRRAAAARSDSTGARLSPARPGGASLRSAPGNLPGVAGDLRQGSRTSPRRRRPPPTFDTDHPGAAPTWP